MIKTEEYDSGNGIKIELCGDNLKVVALCDSGFIAGQIVVSLADLIKNLDIPIEELERSAQAKFQGISEVKAVLDMTDEIAQLHLRGEQPSAELMDGLTDSVLRLRGSTHPDLS